MTHRSRQSPPPDAGTRRAVILAAILSVLATAVSVGALALVLARGTGTDQAGQPSPSVCGTVAWSALPGAEALPSGWAIASTRFLVDLVTTTIVGPAPSGSTQGPVVFVSVTCHGSDAGQALALDRAAARVSGDADAAFPKLGDESFAVTSTRTSSLAVHVRRGILVADIEAATSVDQATVEAVARAVDDAMNLAISGNPPPSSAPAASGSTAASPSPASPAPSASSGQSPSPSPSATPASHVIPDLEARLPKTVDGTAMAIDSVTGATALGTDATSQALVASLEALGKTSADLEIARARDPAGDRPIRLYAFRVKGVDHPRLAQAIVSAFRADATTSPTESQVTLAGRTVTKVAYSQGPAEYLLEATGGVVFDIETTDESLVAKVLPLLK